MSRYNAFNKLKIVEAKDGVLEVVFSAPGKLNALDAEAHLELVEIWPEIDRDEAVRAVLLYGEDGTLSSGGDFSMLEAMAGDWQTRAQGMREARDLVYNMINFQKPIVSAIEGVGVGAGLAAALLADVSVAAKGARIIDGHTRLGVAAGDHAAIIWPLLCGMAKAKYYLMTCEPMSGEEAERIGLVSLLTEDGAAVDRAREVAQQLAQGSVTAIAWTKWTLNNWLRQMGPTFDASIAYEMFGFAGPDVQEGMASIKEKRPPKFR